MKVLLVGATGQLGSCLQQCSPPLIGGEKYELITINRGRADLSISGAMGSILEDVQPSVILNAAAYTAVDKAESEPKLATQINASYVQELAEWSSSNEALLIHVSTDFVFNGYQSSAYLPEDTASPLNVYGLTKLQGEQAVLASACRYHIVRTGWVYSEHGANFVKTILRLATERNFLNIVSDQIGTPTYALNLARMIWQLVESKENSAIWHFSDGGVASWYDFAEAILEEALVCGLLKNKVPIKPIKSKDYPSPARRPVFSVLDKEKTWEALSINPVHWRIALREMLLNLKGH